MRLRAVLFAVVALRRRRRRRPGSSAEAATARYERATAAQVATALGAAGQDWASVATDGLKVTLAGAAPDEASRFRALEIARQVVDARRIDDTTTLRRGRAAAAAALRARAPAQRGRRLADRAGAGDRRARRDPGGARRRRAGERASPTCWRSAVDPAPEGWQEALGFGLSVLAELPRAKISVAPRHGDGWSPSPTATPTARALEARLRAGRRPTGWRSTSRSRRRGR